MTMTALDLNQTQITTALDSHREQNTNEKITEDLASKIQDAGVEYIYYQVVTLSGRVIAKAVPAKHLIRNLEKGIQFHRTAICDLQATKGGELLGGGVQAAEFTALPDPETFNVLPWDKAMGAFFCRVYEPTHRLQVGGTPLNTDARGHLIRTHEAFTKATGLVLKTGCEPEMSWFGKDIEVKVRPGASPAYHMGSLEIMRPIYKKVMEYSTAMGLNMIEGDYEDPSQLELNWMFDSCELTADRLINYRMICRQVASEFGVVASFMPKPNTGSMGNGCHHNFSLWKGDENVFEEKDRSELHLTEAGLHALGGVLKHAPASMLIMASTINSYKRFWDKGLFAPSRINWGMDNKTCTVRLSANGRLEYKLPDASVNPYLSHTLLLAAMADGLKNKIDPGPSESQNSYTSTNSATIPLTLGDALTAFQQNTVIYEALPAEMAKLYVDLKADEWARFCGVVTDWERNMYLEYLP